MTLPAPIAENDLTRFLKANPHVTLAHLDGHILHVHIDSTTPITQALALGTFQGIEMIVHAAQPIRPLWLLTRRPRATSPHTACQNEPVKLGCQIQPKGANWVGTAGAPCAWIADDKSTKWGILSNWHVMHGGLGRHGFTQHQPDDDHPAIAHLDDWIQPESVGPNLVDAAIADALVDGKHTIAWAILGQPAFSPTPIDATPGQAVYKSGRTTGSTPGVCTAIGASARIDYGSFNALFQDQDIFEGAGTLFSAAGDSGSMILAGNDRQPTSLLFAGGGKLTIANPIRHVIEALSLSFSP